MRLHLKSKKLSKILCPIYYYSAKNAKQISKVGVSDMDEFSKKQLIGLIDFFKLDSDCGSETFQSAIKYLIENHPQVRHKKQVKCMNSFNKDILLEQIYYSGRISQDMDEALKIYRFCFQNENDGYLYITKCLIKLWNELLYPNTETGFCDFPEHFLATYNVLCYYYLESNNEENIKEICKALYIIIRKFYEVVVVLNEKEER